MAKAIYPNVTPRGIHTRLLIYQTIKSPLQTMPSDLQCVHAHIIHIPGPPNNDNAYLRKDNADVSMIYDVINHAIITPVFVKWAAAAVLDYPLKTATRIHSRLSLFSGWIGNPTLIYNTDTNCLMCLIQSAVRIRRVSLAPRGLLYIRRLYTIMVPFVP